MKLYALHDKKARTFTSFHVERSDAVASRAFAEAVNAQGSVFGKYPEDFELVSVCDVHDVYGEDAFAGHECVSDLQNVVILTASAVVAMRVPDRQLELLKEA